MNSQFEAVNEDPKDNIIINTAYDGHADVIVTGDKHLLALENFRGIKMVNTENMLQWLKES